MDPPSSSAAAAAASASGNNDEKLVQFLAITNSSDPTIATQYLEMGNGNLEMAVSLFMEYGGGVSGGGMGGGVGVAGGGGGFAAGGFTGGGFTGETGREVRAPDATRTMRLVGGPNDDDEDDAGNQPIPAALIAALGGPAAREMMIRNNMMMMQGGGAAGGGGGGGLMMDDENALGRMGGMWAAPPASSSTNSAVGSAARARARRSNSSNSSSSHQNRSSGGGGGAAAAAAGSDAAGRGGARQAANQPRRNDNNDDDDDDDEVQVVNSNGEAMDEDEDMEFHYDDDEEDDFHDDEEEDENGDGRDDYDDAEEDYAVPIETFTTTTTTSSHRNHASSTSQHPPPSLSTMFAPPTHLMHRAGGFLGARNFAKDARRWLLVNIQSDTDFACHALNRDVWRDELVENLVREGFILWQAMSNSAEGQTYVTRYKVHGYPHLAILDPRTGSLLWRKEGWTQVNPLSAEQFVEIASDFCSRHSFDKLPTAARHAYTNGIPLGGGRSSSGGGDTRSGNAHKRPIHELTEEEQLEAAIRASMCDADDKEDDDSDDVVEVLDSMGDDDTRKPSAQNDDATGSDNVGDNGTDGQQSSTSSFEREILSMEVGEEPSTGGGEDVSRVQIRMPDGKRLVRKFLSNSPVKFIYAFVAQSNDEARAGREFELKAKFPPQDLLANVEDGIKSCGLDGEAINVIWK